MKIKAQHTLRQPTGAYTVGAAHTVFDYTPPEPGAEPRLIPVLAFYPASSVGVGTRKPYIHESILPGAGGIETNSYLGASIAEGKHPLLLFSHGYTLACESNTVQCEELASHGYIVVSIGHPGGGSYVLPGGELSLFDRQKMLEEMEADPAPYQLYEQFGAWLAASGDTASLDQHRAQCQIIFDSAAETIERANLWIEDSLAALDWIFAQNQQSGALLCDHVDTDRIGAFGMSFGGATAMSLTYCSDAIKAAANLDGFFYSRFWQQPLPKPVLLMNNDARTGKFLRFPFLNAASDAYLAIVSETTHSSFTDYTEILAENDLLRYTIGGQEVEEPLLGAIDPDRMETIMNTFLLDFFNKYLNGEPSQLLDGDAQPEEVTLLRK